MVRIGNKKISPQRRRRRKANAKYVRALVWVILWTFVFLSTLNFINQIMYFAYNKTLWSVVKRKIVRPIVIAGLPEFFRNYVTSFLPRLWLLRNGIGWTVSNRCLWACWCPELLCPTLLWARPPHLLKPAATTTTATIDTQKDQPSSYRAVYLTAKFGRRPEYFDNQVMSHVRAVQSTGIFDNSDIIFYSSFPDWILRDREWDEHLEFLEERWPPNTNKTHFKQETGGGYWFWKPALIHYHLSQLEEGDFLLYGDVARKIPSWTAVMMETMIERDADVLVEQTTFKEWGYNKADSYIYYCHERPGPSHDNTGMYNANMIVLRKNAGTMRLARYWMESAKNYHLLTSSTQNHPLKFPNAEYYYNHKRDMALLSSLIKCTYDEPEKTYFPYTCLGGWTAYTFKFDGVDARPFWTGHLI